LLLVRRRTHPPFLPLPYFPLYLIPGFTVSHRIARDPLITLTHNAVRQDRGEFDRPYCFTYCLISLSNELRTLFTGAIAGVGTFKLV
jgi:hypothetical protein